MHKPSQGEVILAIKRGISDAEESYQLASGVPLWDGPEYFMTVNIFQSLLRLAKRDCLTLELNPSVVIQYLDPSKQPKRKPKSDVLKKGRCDIVFWFSDKNITRAVIEVKRFADNCEKDVHRVAGLIRNGIEFGVLASLLCVEIVDNEDDQAEIDLKRKIHSVTSKVKQKAKSQGRLNIGLYRGKFNKRTLTDEGNKKKSWLWCSVCFKITRKS